MIKREREMNAIKRYIDKFCEGPNLYCVTHILRKVKSTIKMYNFYKIITKFHFMYIDTFNVDF